MHPLPPLALFPFGAQALPSALLPGAQLKPKAWLMTPGTLVTLGGM
jgi:hypothetical protein